MRPVLVAAALLLGLATSAGPATAHGASVTQQRDAGPYHVVFYTYDFITENETVRLAWNVTDAATGARVHVDDAKVEVTWTATSGRIASQRVTPLKQLLDGFVFEDFTTGPEGKANFVLPLPQAKVPFEQQVYPLSTSARNAPAKTPGFDGLAALAALALLAAAQRKSS